MELDPDDPVLAVIAPPRLERFRALLGLRDDEAITADFSGWSKLVLLSDDLAILFPRDQTQVEALDLEIEALRTLEGLGLAQVPQVVAVWNDPAVSANRVVVTRRLPGTMLDQRIDEIDAEELGGVLEQVARLAACWHEVDPGPLVGRPDRRSAPHRTVDELLSQHPSAPSADDLAGRVGERLELDAATRLAVAATLRHARALAPVVVHGDLHEGQILVDDDLRVTGIVDWQTARVAHPFTEFDLGEWGSGTWQVHRRAFPDLRRRQWDAYAIARGLPADLGPTFEIFWSLVHALRWPDSVYVGSEVTGTFAETRATLRQALA